MPVPGFGKSKSSAPAADAPASTSTAMPPQAAGLATTKQTGALVNADYDAEDLGAGLKDLTQDDLQIPFLAIMQKGSPQVEEDNPRYIQGAKPGMFFNTVTNEIFSGKDGVRFIPVHRVHNYIEWIPRDDGGGFVAAHDPMSEAVRAVLAKAGRKFGKLKIGDNNDLVETFNVFALLLKDGGTFDRVVLGFSSSQIGRYKRLMTRANSIQLPSDHGLVTPPLFAHVYRGRTEFVQKNDYTWYKWLIDFDGTDAAACRLAKDNPLFLAAKEFRALVQAGSVQAAYESTEPEASEAVGDTYAM